MGIELVRFLVISALFSSIVLSALSFSSDSFICMFPRNSLPVSEVTDTTCKEVKTTRSNNPTFIALVCGFHQQVPTNGSSFQSRRHHRSWSSTTCILDKRSHNSHQCSYIFMRKKKKKKKKKKKEGEGEGREEEKKEGRGGGRGGEEEEEEEGEEIRRRRRKRRRRRRKEEEEEEEKKKKKKEEEEEEEE